METEVRKVIVTDLTRFGTPEKLCTAVVDVKTGECFRPMPYLSSARCAELNIHPGAILEGEITLQPNAENPHVEDAFYKNLRYLKPASSEEFKQVLEMTEFPSVSAGFGMEFMPDQKYIPVGTVVDRSIITIKISPQLIDIHEDQFKPGKIKASFTDASGFSLRYLSITDRGFFDYASKHQQHGEVYRINDYLQSQEELYLRVGVGRKWKSGDRDGYWLQVNGIYTFPDYLEEVRTW